MDTRTKVLGGCYLIATIFFGFVIASSFASISANFGGNYEEAFWTAMPWSMILGLVVAAFVVGLGSMYMD